MNAGLPSPETERVGPRRWPTLTVSNSNSLNLIERDLNASSIAKLCRAWAVMRRRGLNVLQRARGFEIGGDPGCPKRPLMMSAMNVAAASMASLGLPPRGPIQAVPTVGFEIAREINR